jgi:tRNA/tmRNA/rRNA uracil-C5-methylase (TrmA/RlmC/RlmD family)
VVCEHLTRIGGLSELEVDDLRVRVEPLPGGPLGWRTRVQYAVDDAGRPGFRRHRSHDIIPIDRCLIAHPRIQEAPVTDRTWPVRGGGVEVVATTGGDLTIFTRPRGGRQVRLVSGPRIVRERAVGREWRIDATGFWQVHPAAPDALAEAVLGFLRPQPGERAWDLYGGAGLFAAALATALGPKGRVTIVESDPRGVIAARKNLADLPQVHIAPGDVAAVIANPRWHSVDLVVLDPPRAGVGGEVVESVTARKPRAIAYVSCDPAAFARDVATFADRAYRLTALRAFDAFPMTQHVECVGLFEPQP